MKKKRSAQSAFFSVRLLLITLACGTSILTGTLPAFFGSDTGKGHQQTLIFAERVAYQRAIEEVYWRHRIWPGERSGPKPSLAAVMSQAQLEQQVADYLSKSQALEDYWQRPITAAQLQAEMDRMAKHTKQPEVLHELFEALGNDPFVIAECLARPILSERLTTELSTQVTVEAPQSPHSNTQRGGSVQTPIGEAGYTLPPISEGDPRCIPDMWMATSTTNAPSARGGHTAVWTGSEMIVWGGSDDYFPYAVNTGGRYNPATDSWTATNLTDAPRARVYHTAVWTGNEMIIWGGDNVSVGYLNTGGRYNPTTDTWIATGTANAPSGRHSHTAVWTGNEMIIWGGTNELDQFNNGGRYNPTTDSWTATSATNAPSARQAHTAVWTGSEMIIWGGRFFDGTINHWLRTGARYNPALDSWTATSTGFNVPTGRDYHTAIWTGSEMVVWGGTAAVGTFLSGGGRYNPTTDSWTGTSTTNAPSPRAGQASVWTGSEMIVWSGSGYGGPQGNIGDGYSTQNDVRPAAPTPTATPTATATPSCVCPTPTATATPVPIPSPGTGGRYDPVTDSWTDTNTTDAPDARGGHTAVWTGSEMIVWGGGGVLGSLNTGGRYCAESGPTSTPTATPTPTASPTGTPCAERCTPTPRPRPSPAPRP
jgi:N-acetylneuraminic acid mutarotase